MSLKLINLTDKLQLYDHHWTLFMINNFILSRIVLVSDHKVESRLIYSDNGALVVTLRTCYGAL